MGTVKLKQSLQIPLAVPCGTFEVHVLQEMGRTIVRERLKTATGVNPEPHRSKGYLWGVLRGNP